MSAFLGSLAQYLIEMIVLAAVGFCGACIGIKLRKRKNAKAAEEAEKEN